MAKSKNHGNHNQISKAHRNGIKKVTNKRKMGTKGMCPKFLRNNRYAKAGLRVDSGAKEARIEKQKCDREKAEADRLEKIQAKRREFEEEKAKVILTAAKSKKDIK